MFVNGVVNFLFKVYFVISGLPRIESGLRGKDWQAKAVQSVQTVIQILLGKELPIVVVQNATSRGRDAETRYHVKMECTAHSQEIRSKFGYFFSGGRDNRPASLGGISISNRITPASQIRLALLKLIGKRYLDANEGSSVKIIGFEARPMIKIVPPSGAGDSRIKNFTFIEAVRRLPASFTPEELKPVLTKVGKRFSGKLRSLFVILDDDMLSSATLRSSAPSASASMVEDGSSELEASATVEEISSGGSRKRPGGPIGNRAKK